MNNFFDKIKQNKYPYIIAELGSNHNGDMNLARKLIDEAKDAGADCVKFQSWSKETIFSKKKYKDNFFLKDDYRKRSDYSLEQIVETFAISETQLNDMCEYCKKVKIDFSSTPFSIPEVDYLTDVLKVNFLKIASMDLNNYPYLEYVAKKQIPIVLSTGLSTLDEIDKAVNTILSTGNDQLIILHCIAIYPTNDENVNLNNIDTLKQLYNLPIGFSDHSIGFSIPLASVVKGVCIIEKHFTLDKEMFGWDHKVSANKNEMNIISNESKRIIDALGSNQIQSPESELRKNEFRRSIVASTNLSKGSILKYSDLDYKRPGTGISPNEFKYILGRTLNKDIDFDYMINWDDLV